MKDEPIKFLLVDDIRITVESSPATGTTFTALFPRVDQSQARDDLRSHARGALR